MGTIAIAVVITLMTILLGVILVSRRFESYTGYRKRKNDRLPNQRIDKTPKTTNVPPQTDIKPTVVETVENKDSSENMSETKPSSHPKEDSSDMVLVHEQVNKDKMDKESEQTPETIIKDYSEGLAAICNQSGRWGFINEDGVVVISPKYLSVTPFHQGISLVFTGEKWEVINRDGIVLQGKYHYDRCSSDSTVNYPQGRMDTHVYDTDRDPDTEYWKETFVFNTGEVVWLGNGSSSYSGGDYDRVNMGYVTIAEK